MEKNKELTKNLYQFCFLKLKGFIENPRLQKKIKLIINKMTKKLI